MLPSIKHPISKERVEKREKSSLFGEQNSDLMANWADALSIVDFVSLAKRKDIVNDLVTFAWKGTRKNKDCWMSTRKTQR